MATIKLQLPIGGAQFLATAFPAYVRNLGTNFPVEGLAYDGTTSEKAYWKFKASTYGSGNLTLLLAWYADSGTTAAVCWSTRIACITPITDTQDVETKSFATAQQVITSQLGTTAQRVQVSSITITNLDSLAADDEVWIEIARLPADAGDNMTAIDCILIGAEVQYSD